MLKIFIKFSFAHNFSSASKFFFYCCDKSIKLTDFKFGISCSSSWLILCKAREDFLNDFSIEFDYFTKLSNFDAILSNEIINKLWRWWDISEERKSFTFHEMLLLMKIDAAHNVITITRSPFDRLASILKLIYGLYWMSLKPTFIIHSNVYIHDLMFNCWRNDTIMSLIKWALIVISLSAL
jgi:hypothetical protein